MREAMIYIWTEEKILLINVKYLSLMYKLKTTSWSYLDVCCMIIGYFLYYLSKPAKQLKVIIVQYFPEFL